MDIHFNHQPIVQGNPMEDADLDRLLDEALRMHHGWVRAALIMQVREEAKRRNDQPMQQRAGEMLGPANSGTCERVGALP